MKSVLVTGGTGFIGKNLIKKLSEKRKIKIILLTKKASKNFKNKKIIKIKSNWNLSDKNFKKIKILNPSVVIHLAWSGIPDYGAKNSIDNLNKQINFFDKIHKIKSLKTIIVTGSCWEYMTGRGICYENSFSTPKNFKYKDFNAPYFIWAKNSLRAYLKFKFLDINIIWLRLFYVYGEGQKNKSLIPYLIKSRKKNKKVKLNNPYGSNDFINVKDVCKAIIKSIDFKKSEIFNIGTGKLVSIKSIKNFIDNCAKKKEIKIKYEKNLNRGFRASLKKSKKLLKWKPQIKITDGIKSLIKF